MRMCMGLGAGRARDLTLDLILEVLQQRALAAAGARAAEPARRSDGEWAGLDGPHAAATERGEHWPALHNPADADAEHVGVVRDDALRQHHKMNRADAPS